MATEEYSKEKIEELSKELEWKYKYKDSTVLPTKTSVSRLKEESQEILKNKIEEKNLKEDGEVKLEELKNNQFGEINKSIKKLKIEETKLFEDLENNVPITLDKPKFLKDK